MKHSTLSCLVFLLLSACQSAQPIEVRMQTVLDQGIKKYQVHGASATVIFPDGRVWTGVSGYSHDTVTMKPDMVFGIGSITKNVMAALTLKLVEQDMLALDDPISRWLPPYPHVDGATTIRQLLNHTSGLYMFWDNDQLWEDLMSDKTKHWSPEQVLQYIREPYFEAGEGQRYSNTNYLLLAMIIKTITGKELSENLRDHFWEPLRMNEVYLILEDTLPEHQAHVYGDDFQFGGKQEDVTFVPRTSHESITYGSSGLFMSSRTLAAWSHALFEGEVLRSASMSAILQFVEFEPYANMEAYGLGTQVYDRRFTQGEMAIGHGGGNIGTSTYMLYFPDYHVSIVVMINAYPNNGINAMTKDLIRLVLKDIGALGMIQRIEFFPTELLLLCLGISVTMMITLLWIKRTKKRK